MVIPLDEGVSGGVIEAVYEGVNGTVKERMIRMIVYLYQQPNLKTKELAKVLNVLEVSVCRDL